MPQTLPDRDKTATFWEHMSELRNRLFVCVAALLVGFIISWFFRDKLFGLLTRPVREGLAAHGIHRLTAIETVEAIIVYLKMCVASSILAGVPIILYQLWAFVKPALLPHEKRPMRRIVIVAPFMFAVGLVFCYRVVLSMVIEFLTGFTLASGGVDFQVTMRSAYSTAIAFLAGFGIIFELPLVMVLLAATPLFDSKKYLRWTRHFLVLSFVIGSLLTPPDVLSQILMAVPMGVLYFIGIGLTVLMERNREKGDRVRAGFDWPLLGAVALCLGLLTILAWPKKPPMTAYLPWGARAVVDAGPYLALRAPCNLGAGLQLREPVCAVYPEGVLLLSRAPEDETVRCDDPAFAGGLACAEVRGWIVAGHPILLARFISNWEQALEDSDPLTPAEGSRFRVFYSIEATPREHRAYLRIAGFGGEHPSLKVTMVFPDPNDVKHFAAALDQDIFKTTQPDVGALSRDPLVEALEELAGAVEELAALEDSPKNRTIREHVGKVRQLVSNRLRPAHALSSCRTIQCAWAVLSPHLPKPTAVDPSSRRLDLTIPLQEEKQLDLLANLLADLI